MTILQNIIFPEQEVCTEPDLYYHLHGLASFCGSSNAIFLQRSDLAQFNSFFNAFSIGKWHKSCNLDGLFISVKTKGRVEIKVFHAIPDRSWEILASEVVNSKNLETTKIDLSHYKKTSTKGVIYFEVKGLGSATFHSAQYETNAIPDPETKLAISITTFRREDEIQETIKRLKLFLKQNNFNKRIHIFVVDNGQTAKIISTDAVTYMKNANLGGSGGFARGLQEAEAAGYSHCLFMDDDASFHMENVQRTYMFLALAKNKKTAVAGAMISNAQKWAMWENGAYFDRTCHPLFCGADLREFDNVIEIEKGSSLAQPKGYYGGWWFFAFAIEHIRSRPFPFFVRGDDINFSLSNDFDISTINGVVSFQDDFSDKESPLTLYLDLRNHLVQHLTVPYLEIGGIECARFTLRFILRAIARSHYETAQALLLAWNDIMTGPQFFADNADMNVRRQTLGAMIKDEKWTDIKSLTPNLHYRSNPNESKFKILVLKYTLNGHLLPFFKWYSNRVEVKPADRSSLHAAWGASRLTYFDRTGNFGYTVQHSKLRAAQLLWQTAKTALKFLIKYPTLIKQYRDDYGKMTSKSFWVNLLETHNN